MEQQQASATAAAEVINPWAPEEFESCAQELRAQGVSPDALWVMVREDGRPDGKKPEACPRVLYRDYDEGTLSQQLVPGSYISELQPVGVGRRGVVRVRKWVVSGASLSRRAVAVAGGSAPAPAPVLGGGPDLVLQLLLAQTRAAEESNRRLVEIMLQRSTIQSDPIALLSGLFDAGAKFRHFLSDRGGGDDGGAGALLGVVDKVLDRLPPRPAPAPAPAPALPAPAPADPVSYLSGLVSLLSGAADRQSDPDVYAPAMLDVLGALGVEPAALAARAQGSLTDELVSRFPLLAARREWLLRLEAAVRSIDDDDDDDDDDDAGAAGAVEGKA